MAIVVEDPEVKPFYLPLSLMTHTTMMDTHTLMDLEANISVMSSHVWETLGKPLFTLTNLTFLSLFMIETPFLGVTDFKMQIQDKPYYIKIYVANQDVALQDIILG